jgi:hypothetical protein
LIQPISLASAEYKKPSPDSGEGFFFDSLTLQGLRKNMIVFACPHEISMFAKPLSPPYGHGQRAMITPRRLSNAMRSVAS